MHSQVYLEQVGEIHEGENVGTQQTYVGDFLNCQLLIDYQIKYIICFLKVSVGSAFLSLFVEVIIEQSNSRMKNCYLQRSNNTLLLINL